MKKLVPFLLLSLSCFACQESSLTLWSQGHSDYVIYLSADATEPEVKAAEILQTYLARSSEVKLPIVQDSSQSDYRIFMGTDFQLEETAESSVHYRVSGNDLYIYGGSARTTLEAVYIFLENELGCRFYHPAVEKVPALTNLEIAVDLKYSYDPPIITRTVHSKLFYDHPEFAEKLRVTQEAFPFYVPAARVHTFHRFLPALSFYEEHPEYYALRNGKRIPTQLCLTNESVFRIIRDSVAARLEAYPEAEVISVSQDDNTQYCQCENCEAIHQEEESPSGSMIHFVNRIAREFPDKQISTLAYQYTRKAPKNLTPEPNVLITLCSIECDRSASIAEKCPDFAADLRAWGTKTDNVRIWDYTTQFTNFLAPFPNLHTLQPNLRLFRDNNAKWVFEQHSRQPSELFALRSYLTAKLLWNPDANVEAVIDDFLEGYYEEAAPLVREYIDRVHEELAADSTFFLFLYGDPSQGFESFLRPEMLAYYDSLYDQAEGLVQTKPAVLQRVREARLSVDYAMLEQAKRNLAEVLKTESDFTVQERLNRFEQTTQDASITMMNEMRYSVEEYLQLYQQTLARATKPNLASGKPVRLLTQPKKYAKEDPQTLTDGAFGSSSFYANWLGFEGNHLEAIVDLEETQELNEISAGFLQVVNHIVFFPTEVRYYASEDGENFALLGTVKNVFPLQPTSKVNDIQYFSLSVPNVRTRYLKIEAQSILEAPVWHHGAGLGCWIFMDEWEVR